MLGEHRGHGVGQQLLLHGEAEIAERGYRKCRLRIVKSNVKARSFYSRLGWQVEREFRHETLPVDMLEMSKND